MRITGLIIQKVCYSIVNAVKRQGIYTIDLGYYLTFGTNTSNAVLGLMDIIYKSNYEDSK